MNKGAVGKAIAELGVIVLGVLIALFAESAWTDHQARLKGVQDRLKDLVVELENAAG